jgi:hypothetical protein
MDGIIPMPVVSGQKITTSSHAASGGGRHPFATGLSTESSPASVHNRLTEKRFFRA